MKIPNYFSPNALDDDGWKNALGSEFRKKYFETLVKFYEAQDRHSVDIFPRKEKIFAAFNKTPLRNVKVVILGQDPYHRLGQAMGLSFSVPANMRIPPSLRNIYKEISSDLGCGDFRDGDLTGWANQGVLLLNSVLTVSSGQAGSHRGKGWEQFTDQAILSVSQETRNSVFMLWGAWAVSKKKLIDASKHLILEAPHPSPLSAYRGFFGCRHFSKANNYLEQKGRSAIQWQ